MSLSHNRTLPLPILEDGALLEDLAVLSDGPAVQLHLSFDGAVISAYSDDRTFFGKSVACGWQKGSVRARAQLLLRWIHEAAEEYRKLKGLPKAHSKREAS